VEHGIGVNGITPLSAFRLNLVSLRAASSCGTSSSFPLLIDSSADQSKYYNEK